jgi:AcrR family transcriptional regulator
MRVLKKQRILNAALEVSVGKGYRNITRKDVAGQAGVATGSVTEYFKDMGGLRDAVMVEAIRLEILPIIQQGLAYRDPLAIGATGELRSRAILFDQGV